MSPTFSIITCTWNSMPWIDASIASVLQQDCQDFEYLFVDGGSTDGTLERIRAVPRPYRLLENVRGGISRAMNAGLEAARGDIIAHLHSDDFYVRPDVLSMVARQLEDSGAEWLFGRAMPVKHGILQPENFVAPRFTYEALVRANFIPHPSTFVRRRLFARAGGFNAELKYAMDYELWLRLARIEEPLQLDIPLAAMREHDGSLTTREWLAAMQEALQVRLAFSGQGMAARSVHYLRYLVRRRRAMRSGAA
ncbi:MAG TPA: glycosyltransferase family 2 protein [Noviherbaspirillum sp.]|nr:glycosyltransferase family 2 protein [Noviherbaspirillum sp.]